MIGPCQPKIMGVKLNTRTVGHPVDIQGSSPGLLGQQVATVAAHQPGELPNFHLQNLANDQTPQIVELCHGLFIDGMPTICGGSDGPSSQSSCWGYSLARLVERGRPDLRKERHGRDFDQQRGIVMVIFVSLVNKSRGHIPPRIKSWHPKCNQDFSHAMARYEKFIESLKWVDCYVHELL